MPKANRLKFNRNHESTNQTSLLKRKFSMPENHSKQLTINDDSENLSANEILKELNKDPNSFVDSNSNLRNQRVLPLKQINKPLGIQPYSKSHARRLKRRLRDQSVVGDLNPVKAALEEMIFQGNDGDGDGDDSNRNNRDEKGLLKRKRTDFNAPSAGFNESRNSNKKTNEPSSLLNNVVKSKKIIHQHQKSQVLQEESKRIPNILIHPEFQKNPFATIRAHVKNSMELNHSSSIKKISK